MWKSEKHLNSLFSVYRSSNALKTIKQNLKTDDTLYYYAYTRLLVSLSTLCHPVAETPHHVPEKEDKLHQNWIDFDMEVSKNGIYNLTKKIRPNIGRGLWVEQRRFVNFLLRVEEEKISNFKSIVDEIFAQQNQMIDDGNFQYTELKSNLPLHKLQPLVSISYGTSKVCLDIIEELRTRSYTGDNDPPPEQPNQDDLKNVDVLLFGEFLQIRKKFEEEMTSQPNKRV
jgi:hypothetical protein